MYPNAARHFFKPKPVRNATPVKGTFCNHRRSSGRQPWAATGRYSCKPRRGPEGKLVIWQRHCAICAVIAAILGQAPATQSSGRLPAMRIRAGYRCVGWRAWE